MRTSGARSLLLASRIGGGALYALSCILLILSFPTADLWPLAYVALVPWFLALGKTSLKRAAIGSWLLGLAFFGFEVSWLRFVTIPGWLSLAGFLSLYFLAFGSGLHLVRQELRLGFVTAAPICWVALEYVRSFLLSGFSWFFMGQSQYQKLAVIQIADLGGVYAVSFILLLVNSAIADTILAVGSQDRERGLLRPVVPIAVAFSVLAATLVYGMCRLREYAPIPGPRISTIQGSIPQRIKDDPTSAEDVLNTYLRISEQAFGQGGAMLVWPETMVPGFLNLAVESRWGIKDKRLNDLAHDSLLKLVDLARRANRESPPRLLVGGQSLALKHDLSISNELCRLNSAYYIDVKHLEQKLDFVGRYDKIELVPFGEYTPLNRYFPFLSKMVPYEVGFEAGQKITLFDLDGVKFGVLICYEDTIPRLVRRFRQAGAQFLVNISNDGWFEGSMELDAHLAICVFRAVENRVGIVRSVNTGISGFISPTGLIEGVVSVNGRRKNVEGVLTRQVKLDTRQTLYTRYGDWLGRACLGILLAFLILSARNHIIG